MGARRVAENVVGLRDWFVYTELERLRLLKIFVNGENWTRGSACPTFFAPIFCLFSSIVRECGFASCYW